MTLQKIIATLLAVVVLYFPSSSSLAESRSEEIWNSAEGIATKVFVYQVDPNFVTSKATFEDYLEMLKFISKPDFEPKKNLKNEETRLKWHTGMSGYEVNTPTLIDRILTHLIQSAKRRGAVVNTATSASELVSQIFKSPQFEAAAKGDGMALLSIQQQYPTFFKTYATDPEKNAVKVAQENALASGETVPKYNSLGDTSDQYIKVGRMTSSKEPAKDTISTEDQIIEATNNAIINGRCQVVNMRTAMWCAYEVSGSKVFELAANTNDAEILGYMANKYPKFLKTFATQQEMPSWRSLGLDVVEDVVEKKIEEYEATGRFEYVVDQKTGETAVLRSARYESKTSDAVSIVGKTAEILNMSDGKGGVTATGKAILATTVAGAAYAITKLWANKRGM